MSLCANCGIEIRFKVAEYVIVEPPVLNLAKAVVFGKLFLKLDGKITPVLMDVLSKDRGRCPHRPRLESIICTLLEDTCRCLRLQELITCHVIHD
jgi:hypothetical protein